MKIKNIVASFLILSIIYSLHITYAGEISTNNWYVYKGQSTTHSYQIKFPTDWQARTFGEDNQGLAPKNLYEDILFSIKEFEGKSFDNVIDYYENDNTEMTNSFDYIFQTNKGDLIAKKIILRNISENKEWAMNLIKRGTLIIALSNPNLDGVANFPVESKYNDIMEAILSSFTFTDNWHQYIDFKEKYTIIFPSSFKMENLSNGVEVKDTAHMGGTIFMVLKYGNIPIDQVVEKAMAVYETLDSEKTFNFHGLEGAISANYLNTDDNLKVSRVYVGRGSDSFAITNINIESNYPDPNYYDQFKVEMLESFEIFDIEGEYHTYKHFPDVRENHPNVEAIDGLADLKIISGYPDGTFQPNGEINRAELTKLVVNAVTTVDKNKYKDCFPDVAEEWFSASICYAKEKGWVEGYPDGKFKPGNTINRVEAMKIILEVMANESVAVAGELKDKTVLDIAVDDWYGKYFIFADNNNLLDKQHIEVKESGYNYFPNKKMTRKEVAELIYRAQNL